MEYFSAAFEGGLIFFAALAILFNGVMAFIQQNTVHNYVEGFYYSLAATLFNLVTGLYLLYVGNKNSSEAMKASGKHVLSDVATTFGVFLSLGLVYLFKDPRIDAVISLIFGFVLANEAYKVMRSNSGALLDEADENVLELLSSALELKRVPAVIDIHHLRMIRSGNFHHIDAHMVVPEFYDIKTVHEISNDFEKSVVKQYQFDGEFAFHTDPCMRLYCKVCSVETCPVRQEAFKHLKPWTSHHIVAGPRYSQSE